MPSAALASLLPAGVLFPESVVQSGSFKVLAAVVAINTVMYGALAVAKMLPRVHPSDWFGGGNRRRENRSIHPDVPAGGSG